MNNELNRNIDKVRWITLILVLLVGSTSAFLNCLSVYITPLAEKGWNPSVIVFAYTLMMFMAVFGSLIGGKLQQKIGNKNVLKVCGLGFMIAVIGASFATSAWIYVVLMGGVAPLFVYCIYAAQLGNLGALFPERIGFVTGALMVGIYGIGAVLVPLATTMTASMDVMTGIRILAISIGAITIIAGFISIEAPKGYAPKGWTAPAYSISDEEQDGMVIDTSWKKLITLRSFWILFIGQTVMGIFCAGAQGAFIPMAMSVTGCTEASAASSYSIFAILMGCSGLVIGFLSDKFWGPIKWVSFTAIVAAAFIFIFVFTGNTSYSLFVIFVVVLGITVGSSTTLLAVILMKAFGNKYFGVNFGIFNVAMLISSYVGPQLAVSENINVFLGVGAAGLVIGAILFLIGGVSRNKETKIKLF